MGADLYIPKLRAAAKAEWQPKFDDAVKQRDTCPDEAGKDAAQKLVHEAYGKLYADEHYFRDSYNGTSVLHVLGLSWWHDMEYDLDPETDPDERNVSAELCRKFAERVAAAEMDEITEEYLRSRHCALDDGENNVEKWRDFFVAKRQRLIEFLNRAAEHGGMYASC